MSLNSSIPLLNRLTLTIDNYVWLHQNGWEAAHYHYFAEKRAFRLEQILQPPSFSRKRRYKLPELAARWVLADSKNLAHQIGWAEAQVFYHGFTNFYLFVSLSNLTWDDSLKLVFSRLISGVFASSRSDLIYFLAIGSPPAEKIQELAWGDNVYLNCFNRNWLNLVSNDQPIIRFPGVLISSPSWWEKDHAQEDRKALAYIENRHLDPEKKATRKFQRSGMTGFFGHRKK